MNRAARCCCVAAVLLAVAPVADAQRSRNNQADANMQLRPPTPRTSEKPATIMNYLTAIILAGAVLGVAAMPAKRGHQD